MIEDHVDAGQHGYPRPQLRREHWQSLNGPWEFAIDAGGHATRAEVAYDQTIIVPFAPETPASGIGDTGFYRACWYRRDFSRPELEPHQRILLNFGAVDYVARVWVNGQLAGVHEGGYTPFQMDL